VSTAAWFVYMVRCRDGSLYTGIARDVERRVAEHNGCDGTGAKYTRARRPVELVYRESLASRSAAAKREHAIKALSKLQKEALVGSGE
jgi:predicted GIY-YIG superfamily endonuclease